MIKSKKQMFIVIGVFTLVMLLGTVTYAFFNYTRTGSPNTIKVGKISFNSTQDNTINLTNVFPTDSEHLDNTNSSTVTINITGDTTYDNGIEYKVSLEQVNNTINNKEVPISFSVEESNLGRKSSDYYNERGIDENVYNLRESGTAENGKDILIGYIKPDNNGVNGSIDITAYIDSSNVAISDTVSRIENGNLIYGETPGDWIAGRVVLTTTEWNSLSASGISFKVKVEANEGIWVDEPKLLVLKNLNNIQDWKDIRTNITSIEFHKDGIALENPITSFDATDLTSEGPITVYTIDDGLGNNTVKAIIVANDIIYAPEDSQTMFAFTSNLVEFNSNNFLVDNVTKMNSMFALSGLTNTNNLINWKVSNVTSMNSMFIMSNLTNVDGLLNWDVSNVTFMSQVFADCNYLVNVNGLVNWNISNAIGLTNMFSGCSNLTNINGLANWNVEKVKDMSDMFHNCTNLTNISALSNWATKTVELQNMGRMFRYCTGLTDINALSNWNVSGVTDMNRMFDGCTSLEYVSGINDWDITSVTDFANMFRNTINHPEFTQVVGTWTAAGTFTPSA